jgi:hypothetical protein
MVQNPFNGIEREYVLGVLARLRDKVESIQSN